MSYHFLKEKYIEKCKSKRNGQFSGTTLYFCVSYQVPVILTFIKFKFVEQHAGFLNVVQEKIMLHVKQSLMLVLQTCLPTKKNLADCWFGKILMTSLNDPSALGSSWKGNQQGITVLDAEIFTDIKVTTHFVVCLTDAQGECPGISINERPQQLYWEVNGYQSAWSVVPSISLPPDRH